MKSNYAITFEFMTSQPITHRGEISASSVRTLAARAIDEAVKANPNLNWSSICIVLDRYDFMKFDSPKETKNDM